MSQNNGRIPIRTCVICREKRQRFDLLRIVKTPEGQIRFDKTGRMNGRGAYVCSDAGHLDMSDPSARKEGIGRGRLKNALRTDIDDKTVELLDEAIASHLAEQTN